MSSNREILTSAIAGIRDELLNLGVALDNAASSSMETLAPDCDQKFKRLYEHADATRRYAVLAAPPRLQLYDPAKTLNRLSGRLRRQPATPLPQATAEASVSEYGDPQKIYECVHLLTQNIQLQSGAGFQGELAVEVEPRLVIRVSPSVALPEHFTLDGHFTLDWDMVGACWTAATHGGHMARAEEVIIGYLRGDRPVFPAPEDCLEWRITEVMQRLSRLLLPWRSAIGVYEPGYMAIDDIVASYSDVVRNAFAQLEKLGSE